MAVPTPPSPSTGAAALLTLRMLVGALMASVVFISLAVFFVLGTLDDAYAVTVLLPAPLLLGLAAHGVCEAVGHRLPAVAPGTARDRAEEQSREAFQARTVLRSAICESVLLVSLAASFVVTEGGFAVYLVGAVVALALLWWHCWPGDRVVARSQESLERDGATSSLREAYGMAPARGGAIREL